MTVLALLILKTMGPSEAITLTLQFRVSRSTGIGMEAYLCCKSNSAG